MGRACYRLEGVFNMTKYGLHINKTPNNYAIHVSAGKAFQTFAEFPNDISPHVTNQL